MTTAAIVAALLERELESFVREVEGMPDDASLWETAGGVTNPVGTLARHVAGNLQHYVGAHLGATGYVRDRPREFGERSGTRAEIVAELARAIEVVRRVVPDLSADALASTYPEAIGGVTPRTDAFLLHLVSHTAFHLGQAGYLRRLITDAHGSTNPLAMAELRRKLRED